MKERKLKTSIEAGWCVIQYAKGRLLLAHGLTKNLGTQPTFASKAMDGKSLPDALKELVKEHKLQGMACSFILNPSDYRVFLADPPNVPTDERSNALPWLVQDLIDYPIEEAVVDAFDIPAEQDKSAKIYIVVSKLAQLQSLIEAIEQAEMLPKTVTVSEIGFNQMLALTPKAETTQAFIFRHDKTLRMVLSKQGVIRKVRDLGNAEEILKVEQCARLVSALQRSFEFYQATLGSELPVQLLLAKDIYDQEAWRAAFSEVYSLPLAAFSLPDLPLFSPLAEGGLAAISLVGEALTYASGWAPQVKRVMS